MKVKYIVAFFLFIMFLQGFYISATKSRTIDEINYHLNSGYQYLTTGKWTVGLNNPPLTATLAAIPLLFYPDKSKFNNFDRVREHDYIYEKKEQFPQWLLLVSRLVPITFMILLGYFIFLWARDLYGVNAGLMALLLYTFSPNILAFGTLITADIGGAFFIFLSMYTFWKYVNNPTKKNLLIAGLCFGLAQVTKMLSIFLIPTFILYGLFVYFFGEFKPKDIFLKISEKRKKLLGIGTSLAVIFLIGLSIINITYLFDGTFKPLSKYEYEKFESSMFKKLYENPLVNWIPLPLPQQYVLGHDLAQWQAKDERRGFFFLGKIGERFKSYYLFHILVKTPLGLFVILGMGVVLLRKIRLSEVYMVVFILMILIPLTFFSKLLIGYRHVLSIYPLLYVLSSRILINEFRNKIALAIAGIAAIWYITSSLIVFPHHIAYFNEIVGGPKNGYKYTIDSNLDWEQDLNLVRKYIKEHKNEEIAVDPGCQPVTGKLLIPANSLQFQKWACYQWLKANYEPVDYIGYSWLVFDVKGEWIKTDNGPIFKKIA